MKWAFWLSLVIIAFTYLGYLYLLRVFAALSSRGKISLSKSPAEFKPSVSLLISAYNEEKSIEEKLKNSLALDYPKGLLEIIVISDGSEDRTNEIAKRFNDQGVILKDYATRSGKSICLNRVVPTAKGDIIIFSDANSNYQRDAVKELIKHFLNPEIGFVSGTTKYIFQKSGAKGVSVGFYGKVEMNLKALESQLGSCVGADGAIFAIRKELYKDLKDYDINDLVIPFHIIKQGYRGILDEKAYCLEKIGKGLLKEFNRQVRITNRTIRAIINHLDLLNPYRFGIFSILLIFHKVFKLLVPIFVLIILIANIGLFRYGLIYETILYSQFILYGLAAWGLLENRGRKMPWFISMPVTFGITNLAILIGWVKYFQGEKYTTWQVSR